MVIRTSPCKWWRKVPYYLGRLLLLKIAYGAKIDIPRFDAKHSSCCCSINVAVARCFIRAFNAFSMVAGGRQRAGTAAGTGVGFSFCLHSFFCMLEFCYDMQVEGGWEAWMPCSKVWLSGAD